MFQDWENFYILIGSASGALIGLLFVVVTLTSGLERDRALRAASLYMTPTVVMFATVLVIGALATAPGISTWVQCCLIGAMAPGGVAYGISLIVGIRRMRSKAQHWSDVWCYGVLPTAAFAALGVADALVLISPRWAPYGVGAVMVAMLLTGIRNAWDLITWMAPGPPPDAAPDAPAGETKP